MDQFLKSAIEKLLSKIVFDWNITWNYFKLVNFPICKSKIFLKAIVIIFV